MHGTCCCWDMEHIPADSDIKPVIHIFGLSFPSPDLKMKAPISHIILS